MRQEFVGNCNLSIVIASASHSHPALAGCHRGVVVLFNRFSGLREPETVETVLIYLLPAALTQLKQGVNERPTYSFLAHRVIDNFCWAEWTRVILRYPCD